MRDDTRNLLSRLGQPSFNYREHLSSIDDVSPAPWPLLLAVERSLVEKHGRTSTPPQAANAIFGTDDLATPRRAPQDMAIASLIRRISGGAR